MKQSVTGTAADLNKFRVGCDNKGLERSGVSMLICIETLLAVRFGNLFFFCEPTKALSALVQSHSTLDAIGATRTGKDILNAFLTCPGSKIDHPVGCILLNEEVAKMCSWGLHGLHTALKAWGKATIVTFPHHPNGASKEAFMP